MGRFKTAIRSAKRRRSVKRTTDSTSKFDNGKKSLLADSWPWYDKANLSKGNFEEHFSVENAEESYDDEETEEIHWVKPSASLYLVDPHTVADWQGC